MTGLQNILPPDGEAYYFPSLFDEPTAGRLMDALLESIDWKHEHIKIFGKEVLQPRLTAWYGDEGRTYRYSGITMQPLPWTSELDEIRQCVERKSGTAFNSALLNLYRDGRDYMGWHRDNERSLGPAPVIASVSFGTPRIFRFRRYRTRDKPTAILLEPGSLLLMRGATQQHWEHSLPRSMKANGPRINITFRVV